MTPPRITSTNDSDAALAALTERHPGWRVWRSKGSGRMPGAYYATRRRALTTVEAEAGVAATLGADTVAELAAKLASDRAREGS